MKTSRQRREQRKRAQLRKINLYQNASSTRNAGEIETAYTQWRQQVFAAMCGAKTNNLVYNRPVAIEAQTTQEQEITMNTQDIVELKRQDYFLGRTMQSYYETDRELPKQYGLRDDDAPRTVKDALARIASGKFVPPSEKEDHETSYWSENIRWRDPAVVEDVAGCKAARSALVKAVNKTKDQIVAAATPAEMLTALEAFETANVKAN